MIHAFPTEQKTIAIVTIRTQKTRLKVLTKALEALEVELKLLLMQIFASERRENVFQKSLKKSLRRKAQLTIKKNCLLSCSPEVHLHLLLSLQCKMDHMGWVSHQKH